MISSSDGILVIEDHIILFHQLFPEIAFLDQIKLKSINMIFFRLQNFSQGFILGRKKLTGHDVIFRQYQSVES